MAARSGRAVVVGAGISGLTAALDLLDAGAEVTVLESRPRTGGLLHAGDVDGVRVDLGAEAMLVRRPEGVDLARRLGLGESLVSPGPARPAVWRTDGVRPLPGGTVMGVPGTGTDLGAILTPEERRATQEAMTAAARRTPVPSEYDVAVAPAVERDVGRPVLDLLVEPLLGGVYAGRTEQLSLTSTVPSLARAHRDGEPLAHAVDRAAVSSTPGVPVFTGLAGGMARLADGATARLREGGATVRTGVHVTGLARVPGGWQVETSEGPVEAGTVVLALPTTTTARLLDEAVPEAARELAGVPVASVAVVALAVAGLEPDTSGLLVPPVEAAAAGVDVKAVTFSATKWDWVGAQSDGAALLRASLGRAGETAVLQRDDDALVDLVRRDLTVLLGEQHRSTLRVAPARVARWGGALPQYLPGHADRVGRLQAAVRAAGGLGVTGAFVDGVGVPACIAGARATVARLLRG